jgi:hypothetical protein
VSLRLFIVSNEQPFPPIHGGRVDQWSRYRLFWRRGVRLGIATWYVQGLGEPSAAERAALAELFDQTHLFPISRDPAALFRRLLNLPRYSPHVSTRILQPMDFERLLADVRQFKPNAIWLDGLYGGETGRRLAAALDLPLFYRSHNVEFAYMRAQAKQARSWRDRIAWRLASLHLEDFEANVQRSSRMVFDISQEDLIFWRARGIDHNIWAPPLFDSLPPLATEYKSRPWDIVYLGNLSTPNNIRGLEWFVSGALPLLEQARTGIKIRIAGSNPTEKLRRLLRDYRQIQLDENPADASAVLRSGRILINPIFTGSGVNVKSIEMLFHDAHVVTTPAGVRGLPRELYSEFLMAETVQDFAGHCISHLDRPFFPSMQRVQARQRFGPAGIDPIIEAIHKTLGDRTETTRQVGAAT